MSWEKFAFVTDVHGDMQDPASVTAFHKFCAMWKPTVRVCGGDAFDFRAIRKGASDEEKRDSMLEDFRMGWEFMETFKPTVYLLGNHCQRLWDLAAADKGVTSDFAKKCTAEIEGNLKRMKCRVFPYDRRAGVFELGKLRMVHGFGGGGKTMARTHANAYGHVLMGHNHSIDYFSSPSLDGRFGMSVGCLCDLDMDYLHSSIGSLAHANGWAYGAVNTRTGDFKVWQAEKIAGKFVVTGEPIFL